MSLEIHGALLIVAYIVGVLHKFISTNAAHLAVDSYHLYRFGFINWSANWGNISARRLFVKSWSGTSITSKSCRKHANATIVYKVNNLLFHA